MKETAYSILNHQLTKREQQNEKHEQNIRFWANHLTDTYLEFKEKEKVYYMSK